MGEKLNFAIDNIEILEEANNSQFATLKMDVFASGNNRHSLYIAEDTLKKTAKTILQKPIVWYYDKYKDDATTHEDNEVPVGFVPHDSPMEFRKLADGRVMFSVKGKLWKRYSGRMFEIFQRDKSKAVSVEIEALDVVQNEKFGLKEIANYVYDCITVLGKSVTEAIPGAKADLVSFAAKEREDYEIALMEFSRYSGVDFTIPDTVKKSASKGLDLYKSSGSGGTPVSLAIARHLINNDSVSPDKVKAIFKFLSKHAGDEKNKQNPDSNYVAWMLHGGKDALNWSKSIVDAMTEKDNKQLAYFSNENLITFPYKSMEDVNPALKGIEPPVTLAQANAIARQADAIGGEYGWPTAIKSFKNTHKVEDGVWVEKKKEKEEYSVKVEKTQGIKNAEVKFSLTSSQITEILNNKLSEIKYHSGEYEFNRYWVYNYDDEYVYVRDAQDNKNFRMKYVIDNLMANVEVDNKEEVIEGQPMPVNDGSESYVPEFAEDGEPDKDDENDSEKGGAPEDDKEKDKDVNMSLDGNLDVAAMLAILADETDSYKGLVAKHEAGETLDYAVMCKMAYEKMCKMSDDLKKAQEDKDVYMAENAELKKFKEDTAAKEFSLVVDATIAEVATVLSADDIANLKEDSKNFSLDNADAWKNKVKAFAFSLLKDKGKSDGINRMPNSWLDEPKKSDYSNGWLA